MKKKMAAIIVFGLIIGLIWTGSAFAQEADDDGNPVPLETTVASPEEAEEPSPVCEGTFEHPVIFRIANQYEMEYEELAGYFCEYEFGVGEIVHLLATHTQMEDETTLEEILTMRSDEEMGWGEIWQELGLIGSGRGDSEEEGEEEMGVFVRSQNRKRYNHQSALDDDEPSNNGNKPDSPPGLDKDKKPNKPANLPGKDKGNGHPGNGKKP